MNDILRFLTELQQNNNRDWFHLNKQTYVEARVQFEEFIDQILSGLQNHDDELKGLTAKDCVFRIYRDVRFSHDKSPYKTHFGAYMAAGGRKSQRAGYYLQIEPEGSFMAAGIFQPDPVVLKKIRKEVYAFPEEFIGIVEAPNFKTTFELYQKNMLKRPPQGFPGDFKYISYLQLKDYIASRDIEKNWLVDKDLHLKIIDSFSELMPLTSYLNRALDLAE